MKIIKDKEYLNQTFTEDYIYEKDFRKCRFTNCTFEDVALVENIFRECIFEDVKISPSIKGFRLNRFDHCTINRVTVLDKMHSHAFDAIADLTFHDCEITGLELNGGLTRASFQDCKVIGTIVGMEGITRLEMIDFKDCEGKLSLIDVKTSFLTAEYCNRFHLYVSGGNLHHSSIRKSRIYLEIQNSWLLDTMVKGRGNLNLKASKTDIMRIYVNDNSELEGEAKESYVMRVSPDITSKSFLELERCILRDMGTERIWNVSVVDCYLEDEEGVYPLELTSKEFYIRGGVEDGITDSGSRKKIGENVKERDQ